MKKRIFKITEGYEPKDTYNVDETRLLFWLLNNKTLSLKEDPCNGGSNSKQRLKFLLACNADGTYELPPLLSGNSENPSLL
jgi:hypothetical protein